MVLCVLMVEMAVVDRSATAWIITSFAAVKAVLVMVQDLRSSDDWLFVGEGRYLNMLILSHLAGSLPLAAQTLLR